MPITNQFDDLTEEEYRKFLSNLGFFMNDIKGWMNRSLFGEPIALPFTKDQIETKVKFQDNVMYITQQLNDGFGKYLQDTFIPNITSSDLSQGEEDDTEENNQVNDSAAD